MDRIFSYKTVLPNQNEIQLKEKGSKFMGYIFPVENEKEVSKELEKVKSLHSHSSHICYAYTYGINEPTVKTNDDGEPNHTAGTPIYNQIQSFQLHNVIGIVVRYFGGTKLGVSGLIQAYKQTAKLSIENAEIIEIPLSFTIEIQCSYAKLSSVFHLIHNTPHALILSQKLEQNCELLVEFPLEWKEKILEKLHSIPVQFQWIK